MTFVAERLNKIYLRTCNNIAIGNIERFHGSDNLRVLHKRLLIFGDALFEQ